MTDHATLLRTIRADARPYVEQWLDLSEVFSGFRKLASENGLDWGVIKALIKAEVQDDKEGGSLKVDKIIEKADFASAYADMLGLGSHPANMNEFKITSDLPPHDEDGVIIEDGQAVLNRFLNGIEEPALAPSRAEAEQGGVNVTLASSVALPPIPQPAAPSPVAAEPVSASLVSAPGSLPDDDLEIPAFLRRNKAA